MHSGGNTTTKNRRGEGKGTMIRENYRSYGLLPGVPEDALYLLRRAWKCGETMRIAEWLGLEYIPPTAPEGMDLSDEWAFHVAHARTWIDDIYRRLYEQPPA
jgi:hypothetical protein